MRFRKVLTLILSCMLVLETPSVSYASSISSDTVGGSFDAALDTTRQDETTGRDSGAEEDVTGDKSVADEEKKSDTDKESDEENKSGTDGEPGGGEKTDAENIKEESESAPEQNTPEQNIPEQNIPEQNTPEQNTPEQNVPEEIPELKVALNYNTYTLDIGGTLQLGADTDANAEITWTSSYPQIASVSPVGVVTAHNKGTAEIMATAVLKTKTGVVTASASCMVTVNEPSLKLASKMTVYLKNPIILKAEVSPQGTIQWKSSNRKVAAIDENGKIKPIKEGTTTITASCYGIRKSCKVTVKKPSLKLKTKSITIFAKTQYLLKINAKPADKLKLVSSDPRVVKVSKDGMITGEKKGEAIIKASVPGAKAVTCKVTVLKKIHKINRTSQTLMKGNSTTLYLSNVGTNDSVYFELSDSSSDVAKISYSGNKCKVTAKKEGEITVNAYCSTYVNGESVTGQCACRIKVIDKGIGPQQVSIAVKKKESLKLKNVQKPGTAIAETRWISSNPGIADVSSSGVVTGVKAGSAKITALVAYSDGTSQEFSTDVKISNPKLKSSYTVLAVGKNKKIKLTGTNSYSDIEWKIKKSSVVSVAPDGTVTAGSSTGKAKITITVDGKKITHQVIVTNPSLKSEFKAIAPGNTVKISLSGTSKKSKITYKSKQKSIATVNKSGVVTAKSYGNTDITVTVDGVDLTFQVNVAPQRAISACDTGYSIMYSSTYSQPLRMSQGHYDCSSLVFRAYGYDTGLLGGIPSWAPTAAAMASYMERTGKVISYGAIDVSQLRPGDLLFFSSSVNNGRYRNIGHVSMYYGGGYRLEKPLRYYYPESSPVMIARPIP